MEYFDVSLPLSSDLITYPGNQEFQIEFLKTLEKDEVQLSKIILGTHTGTHIDAPKHFIKGGKGVDRIDVDRLIGPCKVIDCSYVESKIAQKDLEECGIQNGDRVLIKTRNSEYLAEAQFNPNFVSLSLDAAQYLANQNVRTVGIDYLSVEARGSIGHPVHKALLKHEIAIIEGLNLQDIDPGQYELTCLPLKITDGDGSPCRAFLSKA